jgi:hypothetical protein
MILSDKKIFDVRSMAEFTGLSVRRVSEVAKRAGLVPKNFGGRGVRIRHMWSREQADALLAYVNGPRPPNPKIGRRRNDDPLPEPVYQPIF